MPVHVLPWSEELKYELTAGFFICKFQFSTIVNLYDPCFATLNSYSENRHNWQSNGNTSNSLKQFGNKIAYGYAFFSSSECRISNPMSVFLNAKPYFIMKIKIQLFFLEESI